MTTTRPTSHAHASTDRVLALCMRPKLLHECIGQAHLNAALENQFATHRIPHFFIIHGHVGCGKTTLARILALSLQLERLSLETSDWDSYSSFDIYEINAANKNGVDDVRAMLEMMRYKPMPPSKARVVILDEAHQLTPAAQNAMITETEDVARHVFYIFCTSHLAKIIPALQRRAYLIHPKPLDGDDVRALLAKASEFTGSERDMAPLCTALSTNAISSPGLVLQAAEKFVSGLNADEAIHCLCGTGANSSVSTSAVCKAVAAGCWRDAAAALKALNKAEIGIVKNSLLSCLRSMLLGAEHQDRATRIAHAIHCMARGEDCCNETVFLANICLACRHLSAADPSAVISTVKTEQAAAD